MKGLNLLWLVGLILICLFSNCATTPPSPIEKQVHSPNKISTPDLTVSSNGLIEIQDIAESGKSSSRMENLERKEKQTPEVVAGADHINLEKNLKEDAVTLPVAQRGEADNDANESSPLLLKEETLSSAEQLDQVKEKNTVEDWQDTNAGITENDGNISKNLDVKPDITDLVIGEPLPIKTKKDSVEINSSEENGSKEEFVRVVNSDSNESKLESYFDPKRSLQYKNIDVSAAPLKESNTTSLRREKLSILPLQTGSIGKPDPTNQTKIGLKVDLVSESKKVPFSKKNLDFSLPAQSGSFDQKKLDQQQRVNFDSVQPSLLNEEQGTGQISIGFQEQKDTQEFELDSAKLKVGLREQIVNPILRNQTTNGGGIIEPDNSSRKYGHIRSFLGRHKGIKEPREKSVLSQFDRSQNYWKRESNETSQKGYASPNDSIGNRYQKTKEWIKNRGRGKTELPTE